MLTWLSRWWFEDLPALDGRLRFLYYISLLLMHTYGVEHTCAIQDEKCPIMVHSIQMYDELGIEPSAQCGLFAPLLPYVTLGNCFSAAHNMWYAWLFCAVGAFGKAPRVVAALGFAYLHGMYMCEFGKSRGHEHFLAMTSSFALIFANDANDGYSVDAVVRRLFRSSPKTTEPSPWGCAARKLVLVAAVNAFFWSGVHKLTTVGLSWLDGKTILYGASVATAPLSTTAHGLLLEYGDVVAPVLATASIFFETNVIVALLPGIPFIRAFVVLSFALFHLGIKLVMMPNFMLNCCSYLLCIDYGAIMGSPTRPPAWPPAPVPARRKIGALMYTAVAVAMASAGYLQLESWPASSWMLYTWHPEVPGWGKTPYTPAQAVEAATRCMTEPAINPACRNTGGNIHLDTWTRNSKTKLHYVMTTNAGQTMYVDWRQVKPKLTKTQLKKNPYAKVTGDLNLDGVFFFIGAMQWRGADAVAATIMEGLPCIEGGVIDTTRMPHHNGTASLFAAQLHAHLDGSDLVNNDPVELVSILYEFADATTKKKEMCVVGTSKGSPMLATPATGTAATTGPGHLRQEL